MATIRPAMQAAQDAADFYNRNQALFEHAASILNQMAPTIRMIEQMAPTMRMIERAQQDMMMATALARQHAQLTALLPTIAWPTEDELAEAQNRIAELVPETEKKREEVAELGAEIQAELEGKQLIGEAIDWVNDAVARMGDLAAKHVTEVGLALLAFVAFLIPPADYAVAGLYAALACAWLAYRALAKNKK